MFILGILRTKLKPEQVLISKYRLIFILDPVDEQDRVAFSGTYWLQFFSIHKTGMRE